MLAAPAPAVVVIKFAALAAAKELAIVEELAVMIAELAGLEPAVVILAVVELAVVELADSELAVVILAIAILAVVELADSELAVVEPADAD